MHGQPAASKQIAASQQIAASEQAAASERSAASEQVAAAEVYLSDPLQRPDDDFTPGRLEHLVEGNRGRLLDPRRTPVRVLGANPELGCLAVEVEAFEDAGARWELGLEDVARFQFERGAALLGPDALAALEQSRARFDRTLQVSLSAAARARTLEQLGHERERVRAFLEQRATVRGLDLEECVTQCSGSPAAIEALAGLLQAAGLDELDALLARAYVSNPESGEAVKGHAIVLAEMGLCAYSGKAVRAPDLFSGAGAKRERRRHVLLRLAFLTELMSLLGREHVELYRGVALGRERSEPRPASLVSATFSPEVALAHFVSDPAVPAALLAREQVPVARLLMTFLETAAMNERYREAEAVLLCDPAAPLF